jgi:glycogen operon protein
VARATLSPEREFTRAVIKLFHAHPVSRRRKFFQGRRIRGSEVKDLAWFRPDGKEMMDEDWSSPFIRCLGLRLAADGIEEGDARGNHMVDDTLLILLNAHHESIAFILPAHRARVRWEVMLDAMSHTGKPRRRRLIRGGTAYDLQARSLSPQTDADKQRIILSRSSRFSSGRAFLPRLLSRQAAFS